MKKTLEKSRIFILGSKKEPPLGASNKTRTCDLLLRYPKVAFRLERGQLLTAAPFRFPFIRHWRRSSSMQLTARDAAANQKATYLISM